MKKNKGITLIALIITIIILIILTAVTINNVIRTDLIGFATKAVENYTDVAKDEADKVDELVGITDNLGVGKDSIVKAGEIVTETKKDNYTDVTGRAATIPAGFKVSTKSSEQYIKDGLVIQDNDGNEFVWVPCYYADTENTKPDGTAEDVQQYKKHTYEDQTDTECVTVEKGGKGWKTFYYTSFKDWLDIATQKLNNGVIEPDKDAYGNKSVRDYGGFYIARYEAGWDETTVENLQGGSTDYIKTGYEEEKTKRNITTKTPVSKPNVFSWNFISQQNAKTVSENMYKDSSSVDSKLVDGTAWDTITNWIATDGEKIVTESTSYGNYNDTNKSYTGWYAEHVWSSQIKAAGGVTGWLYASKFNSGSIDLQWKKLTVDQWNTKKADIANANESTDTTNYNLDARIEIPTGSYDEFKLKNIYDLAGNMWEWTTEVGDHKDKVETTNSGSIAVFRGGCFNYSGTDGPLCSRHGYHSSSTMAVDIGFRVVLYVK